MIALGDEAATVTFKRRGMPRVSVTYDVEDAKRAKLWSKGGPWTTNPGDMLGWRAVARANRLYWSDITLGCGLVEEIRDIPSTVVDREPLVAPEQQQALPEATGPDPLLEALGASHPTTEMVPAAEAVQPGEEPPSLSAPTTCKCGVPVEHPDQEHCLACGLVFEPVAQPEMDF